ncbi:MAG: hypothetical protein ISS33_06485 [Candidatus Omnitrophica bacterium]|nr:hypothetical protein [Candidatus Omnitrophota bacterium]
MKKCFRVVSVFVLFTFLFNGVALDSYRSFGIEEKSTLSPVLKFSPLAGIEPKEISQVEFVLETALLDYADGESEVDLEAMQDAANEDYAYTSVFDDTHPFFAEREVLADGRILVMTRVLRNEDEKILRTYYAVFSTKKVDGGFDVRAYTEKDWKQNEEIIRRGGDLPKRRSQQPEDAKAIARYKNDNERVIDTFIRERIYEDDFAEIKGRAVALWGKSRKGTRAPKVEFPTDYLTFIKNKLDGFLKHFGTSVWEALEGKNLVFIRVPKGVDYPVIYEKDPISGEMVPIPVRSHTSQHAVYIFLDEHTFDVLSNEDSRWSFDINDLVLPRLIHEIGVIYGLPYRIIDVLGVKRTMNNLLKAYLMDQSKISIKNIKHKFPNLKLNQKVDLNETLWTRDYFMAERKPVQNTDDNLEVLAKMVAKEFYKEFDEKKWDLIVKEVERRLAIYSLKAIIWHLMAQNQLTDPDQLYSVTTQKEADWEPYTHISSSLDTFLRKKVIEWTNAQAVVKGSALRKEVKNPTVIERAYSSNQPTLQSSYGQEKELTDLVLKPMFKELFGYMDPTDFVETADFSDKINSHLKETEKADKGPYWYTVEEDLRRLIAEGKVAKITKDGRVVNVKTGEEIPASAGMTKRAEMTNMVEIAEFVDAIKKSLGILRSDQNCIANFDGFGDAVIHKWAKKRYKVVTEQREEDPNWFRYKVGEKLKNHVTGLTQEAKEMEVYIVLDSAYASPMTKEFVHVGRESNRIWLGELFLKEARRRADEKSSNTGNIILGLMSRLFIDEKQHVGKDGVNHGEITKEEDIGKVVDHIMPLEEREYLREIAGVAWEESMEGKMPWEPLLKGKTVGQSPKMIEFFEVLKDFATNDLIRTALIQGADGHGKTKTIDAVQEMMYANDAEVIKIDCELVKDFTLDKVYDILFKNWEKKKLLVLDNFNKLKRHTPLSEMLFSVLKNVRKGETQLYLGKEKPVDISGLKMLCVAGMAKNKGLTFDSYPLVACPDKLGILEEFQKKRGLPTLSAREDDIVRLAEYFNFEESERRQIDYAPMDEFSGKFLAEMMKKSGDVTIWDVKDVMKNMVRNRTILFEQKELPENSPDLKNWKEYCEEYFSDTVITMADIFYLGKLKIGETTISIEPPLDKIIEEYSRKNELLPYFKELASGKDERGNPIGFYKGRRGEQPGMPRGGRGFPSYPKQAQIFKNATKSVDRNEQEKKKLETLTEYANEVGKLIAPPVSRYTLFTAYDLATDEEYDEDIKSYRSRFNIERISTDKPEDIVEKILEVIRKKGLSGENIIVQLPEEFAASRYDIAELIKEAPGIKFMVIDTKGLKEEDNEDDRKKYRDIIYSMMVLARNIDETSSPMVLNLLNYFIDYCFKDYCDSQMREAVIGTYTACLACNDISEILNVVLSYKYMTKHKLPDKALIAKTLVSA